jgi:hypothetical protein
MSTPAIRAIIEDGPRGGETITIDAETENKPPDEIILPDGHAGVRPPGGHVPHPTGSVSRYRLIGSDDERGGYVYRVVPHEQ